MLWTTINFCQWKSFTDSKINRSSESNCLFLVSDIGIMMLFMTIHKNLKTFYYLHY